MYVHVYSVSVPVHAYGEHVSVCGGGGGGGANCEWPVAIGSVVFGYIIMLCSVHVQVYNMALGMYFVCCALYGNYVVTCTLRCYWRGFISVTGALCWIRRQFVEHSIDVMMLYLCV